MAAKNTIRTTITLEIENGKIVNAFGTDGAKSRKVSSDEIQRLYQNGNESRRVRTGLRAAAESASPCFAYIWLGGKWVKVPVPC
jgi:hypothetical protein